MTGDASIPKIYYTGLGYEYVRCRSGQDHDETVYIHQLLACLQYDPHLVFGAAESKLKLEIPWLLTPQNVYLSAPGQATPLIAEPDGDAEETVHGVPVSEYERLKEIEIEGQRSAEVSNRLRKIVSQQRREAGD